MEQTLRKTAFALALGGLVSAPTAVADDQIDTAPNNSWISVSGTVGTVSPDAFVLDYGDDSILVEMDDWDADADGYKLLDGDEVTVTGLVDHDIFEKKKIEAGSVYVENLNTYFYASSDDEEDAYIGFIAAATPEDSLRVEGTVSEIGLGEFTLNTGVQKIDVDVSELGYDPLDEEGFHKISKGDRVSVSGEMGVEFFVDRDFTARSVVTLRGRES